MAAYDQYPVRSVIKNLVKIPGWFETDGSNAPPSQSSTVFTVGAPSTGVYTVTLRQKPTRIHRATASLQPAAGGDQLCKVIGFSAANGTITIETRATADGAAADIDGPIVHFEVDAEYS